MLRFEAQNFKSIKNLHLDMRPFMVLVGPNGAGKTNVVRALELFGDIIERGTTDPIFEQGYEQLIHREKKPARAGLGFAAEIALPDDVVQRAQRLTFFHRASSKQESLLADDSPLARPVTVRLEVWLAGSVATGMAKVVHESLELRQGTDRYRIQLEDAAVTVESSSSPLLRRIVARAVLGSAVVSRLLRTEKQRDEEQAIRAAFEQEEDSPEGLLRLLNWQRLLGPLAHHIRNAVRVRRVRLDASALRRDSLFEESSRGLIGPHGEGLAIAVARLRGLGKNPEAFRSVLAGLQAVFPRIEDVNYDRIQPGRLILRFKERGISDPLGPSNVSDGVLHALALLIEIQGSGRSGGTLAIEEPENAIHPWSLRTIAERAQGSKLPQRLLFTTHSETMVNAVKDPASLFVVENDMVHGTRVVPANEKENALDAILRQTEQKLGDVWLDGTIGGVPEGDR